MPFFNPIKIPKFSVHNVREKRQFEAVCNHKLIQENVWSQLVRIVSGLYFMNVPFGLKDYHKKKYKTPRNIVYIFGQNG